MNFTGFALNNNSNDYYVGSSHCSYLYYGSTLIWPQGPQHDYSQDYFTIESLVDNNGVYFDIFGQDTSKTIYISIDNGQTWEQKTSTTSGTLLCILNTNEKVI